MATITINFNGLSSPFTVADADFARMVADIKAIYTSRDNNGNPVVPTNAQAAHSAGLAMIQELVNQCVAYEQAQAAATASSAVAPIPLVG